MELFVEFKRGSTSDPFNMDGKVPFPKAFETTCASRGQMVLYATRLQMYQFRTFVFSVGIFGNVARLFRWDRSGAIVSAPIMYAEEGNRELSEFFYRLNLTDRAQRGWDPTVSDATSKEAEDFDQAIETVVGDGENKLFENLLESVGDKANYPRKKVDVLDPSGGQISYIVGRSMMYPKSPTGRCTRGFVAMDMKAKKLTFLKDSWRPDIAGVKSESHWYNMLKGARNIAAFSHGSDVGKVVVRKTRGMKNGIQPQRTLTQKYAMKFSGIENMMGYVHYRIVQCEFYVPLTMFRDSKHLTEIMYDVLLGKRRPSISLALPLIPFSVAIEDLLKKGILHRDISINNIMITIFGRGRLIDFDLARGVECSVARRTIRTVCFRPFSPRQLRSTNKVLVNAIGHVAVHVHGLTLHPWKGPRTVR